MQQKCHNSKSCAISGESKKINVLVEKYMQNRSNNYAMNRPSMSIKLWYFCQRRRMIPLCFWDKNTQTKWVRAIFLWKWRTHNYFFIYNYLWIQIHLTSSYWILARLSGSLAHCSLPGNFLHSSTFPAKPFRPYTQHRKSKKHV